MDEKDVVDKGSTLNGVLNNKRTNVERQVQTRSYVQGTCIPRPDTKDPRVCVILKLYS